MKRNLLLLSLAFFSFELIAQITVTNASWPKAGDTLKTGSDNNPSYQIAPAQSADGKWDFTNLKNDGTTNTIFLAANQGANFSSFPTATLLTQSFAGESYFKVTNSTFEALGFVGDLIGLGFPIEAKIKPAEVERRNPMKYFDINNNTYSFGAAFSAALLPDSLFKDIPFKPDSVRFGQSVTRLDVVDSWGTLKIPGGTYDVLREKRTATTTIKIEIKIPFLGWSDVTSLFGGGGPSSTTDVTYNYVANGSAEPILTLNCTGTGDTIVSADFKLNGNGVGFFDPAKPIANLKAYPNPANQFINVSFSNINEGLTTLEVRNVLGQVVRAEQQIISKEQYTWFFNLNNLNPGLYFIDLKDVKGQLKASGSVTVIR